MAKEITDQWFALKVFFNKVFELEAQLNKECVENYVPCIRTSAEKKGQPAKRKLAVPSLMFLHVTPARALELQQLLSGRAMIYSEWKDYRWVPIPVSDKEMNVFRLVVSAGDEGLEYFEDDKRTFLKGEHVRVIGGPFKGAEGYIRRIKGNHRLIVSLRGICAIATSYIPQCFLEKISD